MPIGKNVCKRKSKREREEHSILSPSLKSIVFNSAEILIKSNYTFAVFKLRQTHSLPYSPWLICPFEFTGECFCVCVQVPHK
jgi:hypothetical protein